MKFYDYDVRTQNKALAQLQPNIVTATLYLAPASVSSNNLLTRKPIFAMLCSRPATA